MRFTRKFDHTSSLIIERQTVHVSDDTGSIAMLETRTVGDAIDDHGTAEELTRYIYSNHLQSASLELDEVGEIISYEEYHPYGTTSYQAMNASINAVAKRYRYTGKERDEESGLYYHGARYYIPWLGRWVSTDPINSENYNLNQGYGLGKNKDRHFLELTASSYEYCTANPIDGTDPTGEQKVDENVKHTSSTPKSKVDPKILQELTKDLDKSDRLPSPKVAQELMKDAEEKAAAKLASKTAEKAAGKTLLKVGSRTLSKANVFLDIIDLITVPLGKGDTMDSYRELQEQAEVERAKIVLEFTAAVDRIATGASTVEEEQKKNPNLIFRSMQTINGEWIKSPLEGAGNARQLGARTPSSSRGTIDITPSMGMVGPFYSQQVSSEGKKLSLGLSASTSYVDMAKKVLGDEYLKKEGAVGMFDRRLLIPFDLEAVTDSKDGHVTIYPRFDMKTESYIQALNAIPWVPIFRK